MTCLVSIILRISQNCDKKEQKLDKHRLTEEACCYLHWLGHLGMLWQTRLDYTSAAMSTGQNARLWAVSSAQPPWRPTVSQCCRGHSIGTCFLTLGKFTWLLWILDQKCELAPQFPSLRGLRGSTCVLYHLRILSRRSLTNCLATVWSLRLDLCAGLLASSKAARHQPMPYAHFSTLNSPCVQTPPTRLLHFHSATVPRVHIFSALYPSIQLQAPMMVAYYSVR